MYSNRYLKIRASSFRRLFVEQTPDNVSDSRHTTSLLLSGLLRALLRSLLRRLLLLLLLSLLLSHLLHNLLLLDQERTENAMRKRVEGTTTDRAGTCGRGCHRRHASQCAGSETACAEH